MDFCSNLSSTVLNYSCATVVPYDVLRKRTWSGFFLSNLITNFALPSMACTSLNSHSRYPKAMYCNFLLLFAKTCNYRSSKKISSNKNSLRSLDDKTHITSHKILRLIFHFHFLGSFRWCLVCGTVFCNKIAVSWQNIGLH